MAEVRYTKSHEWCSLAGDVATCGITQHAADELKDLTFLDYRVAPGDRVSQGDTFGEIDSVKATSELYAPVGGTVKRVNERFQQEEELPAINASPEGEGWLLELGGVDRAEFEALMDADAYAAHCAEG